MELIPIFKEIYRLINIKRDNLEARTHLVNEKNFPTYEKNF